MKKLSLFLLLLSSFFLVGATMLTMEEARNMANRIYSVIDKTVVEKMECLTREDYIEMYGCDRNGKPVYTVKKYPNDLFLINGGVGKKALEPQEYFGEIEEYVNNNNVVFRYEITGVRPHPQAEMRKNEDSPKFADVFIRKEWIIGGKQSFIINDCLEIDLSLQCVSNITNEFVSLQDITIDTMDEMMAVASKYYSQERYEEAASLYIRVTEKYPNNDDAWYYLGVMYFKMQGVGHLSKKQRLQKAYDCWKHSNLNKARRAISYITDGRE